MDDIVLRNSNALQSIDFNDIQEKIQKTREFHVHCNQFGRKYVTTITGIEQLECDLKKLCSKLRNHFSCSCALKENKDKDGNVEKIFKLSGDHRKAIKGYLVKKNLIDDDDIFTIHG